ncbi:P-loop containing nucleoside triphosphate hydrolase protein [Lanmaoa asiatica]|nr:P-loop containing nucleoside triphosphate hydrolase protein [Lanmaoa asiatica]
MDDCPRRTCPIRRRQAQRVSAVDRLARNPVPTTARLLIAIAGVPASGKTSFAARLVQRINALLKTHPSPSQSESEAILIGVDGWHLTRAQLDAMDDPKRAHDRRGIHWTFDAPAYVDFVARLRHSFPTDHSDPDIYAPSFDHALKDPTPDAVVIKPSHRIVVIEGLYTMLDIDPWRRAAAQMDERWWVHIDPARAKTRLVKRHVQTGIAKDMDEAVWRAENNDEDNGRFISRNLFAVTYTIQSIDDLCVFYLSNSDIVVGRDKACKSEFQPP